MVQTKQSKRGSAMEDRSQGTCKSCYCCGATPSHLKKECPARDAEGYECGKKGHFKGSCRLKKEEKEVHRTKDVKSKQKLAKAHELKAQVTAGMWMQQ